MSAGVPVPNTVSNVEPETFPSVAEIMLVSPAVTAVANPVGLIVAASGVAEPHVTESVMSCVVPPTKVAVAVNCNVAFTAIDGFAGVTVMEAGGAASNTTDVGL